ncbi:MAG: hypothetical protein M1828_007386 [Chrysothrix sp. TS-e1954]|nr:MAG: hypothetical protein M1828_007386 [Chrysothrix sp. TS-e1954]
MARILITGSSDGVGLHAARTLVSQGHQVTLHARNAERAAQTERAAPGATGVIIGDISTIDGMKELAATADDNARPFDVVVHNAGVGFGSDTGTTANGMKTLFAVNSLAPYVLTALMAKPKRLVYVTSELHTGGDGSLRNVTQASYGDSKLHNIMLANAVARRWKDVESNSVTPSWVASKLGGMSAPGSTQDGADRLVYLAALGQGKSVGTGLYYARNRPTQPQPAALDEKKQDELMSMYEKLSGISFPS